MTKISAAIAAALAVSAPAFALDPTATAGAQVQLIVSGASAARDAFGALMANTVCASGFSVYRATTTTGQDFRAYSCTAGSAPEIGAAAGKTLAVYYRAEGGSAWGPVPVATGVQVKRLLVNASCTLTTTISLPGVAAGQQLYQCPVTAYNIDTDGFGGGNLVAATTDLAVSDEEPKMYGAPNFPTSTVFNGTGTDGQRQTLLNALNANAQVGFGQVFGIIVNNTTNGAIGNGNAGTTASPFNGVTNPVLSRQTIAGIFNGTYTNWNQVPTATGGVVSGSSLTIRVCRREPGSGTQVAAAQFFIGTPQCGSTLGTFRADGADLDRIIDGATSYIADTDGVIERGTGSDLNACVVGLAGGIGPLVANSAPTGAALVAIDGSVPTARARDGAAVGNYPFWFEQTFVTRSALAGDPLDLANGLITLAQSQATTPNVNSALALPNAVNDPFSQGAFSASLPPVAFATRGGNSCKPAGPVSP